jgi:hypothetical protein
VGRGVFFSTAPRNRGLFFPTRKTTHLSVLRRVHKIAKSDYQLRHVCLSVRMEELGPHGIDFHEISCMSIFRKCVEKIQVLLKSDKTSW